MDPGLFFVSTAAKCRGGIEVGTDALARPELGDAVFTVNTTRLDLLTV